MRIRRKPWARPELDACPYFIKEPETLRGRWKENFPEPGRPLVLELGCGKGVFTAKYALAHPEINLLAIDIKSDILGVARRNIEKAFSEAGKAVDNLLLTAYDIRLIGNILSEEDAVDRILICFCNPWSERSKHHKRRLTHPRQLTSYLKFLKPEGVIEFKTDDDDLFRDSLDYFPETGLRITSVVEYDASSLERSPLPYISEHERMFLDAGKTIHYLKAER